MTMQQSKIDILLQKYWRCETTLEEEHLLKAYFSDTQSLPIDMHNEAQLFQEIHQQQSMTLREDFDKKLQAAIAQQEKEKNYIVIKLFAPIVRRVAIVALIIGLGIGAYLIYDSGNQEHFAETYNDPNAAIKHATFALDKLSQALQKGEQASIESIKTIEGFDIDWSALDSLQSINIE